MEGLGAKEAQRKAPKGSLVADAEEETKQYLQNKCVN